MRTCEICGMSFDTFQAKANHVRWNHKDQKYTDEGLQILRDKIRETNLKRYGQKTVISEQRTCKCGSIFERLVTINRKHWHRQYC